MASKFLPPWAHAGNRKMSRELYLLMASTVGSMSGFVEGFIATLSGILITDASFLVDMGGGDPTFTTRFIILFYVGEMVGAILSFPLSDTFGRKTTLSYVAAVCIICLVWSALTVSGADLLTSRFFVGWTSGVLMATSPLYTSEISTSAERGRSVGILALMITGGSLFSGIFYYIFKRFEFGWRIVTALPALVLFAKIALLTGFPETPCWLLAHKTPAECLISLRQMRRTNDVSKEFNDLYRTLTSDARLGDSWGEILAHRSIRLRMLTACVMQAGQQLLGVQIVTTFGAAVLTSLGVHSVGLGLSLAYMAAVVGTVLGLSNIDIWGRRFLATSGCVCISISWLGAATCAYSGGLSSGKAELYFPSYVLRFFFGSFLCLFSFSNAFSIGIVSWVVPAEIFPLRARARASSLTTSCNALSAIIGAFLLNLWMQNGFNTVACMIIFAILSLLLGIFYLTAVPESTGIMLEEMEELFEVGPSEACCGCCPCPAHSEKGAYASGASASASNLLGFRTPSHSGRGSGLLRKGGKDVGSRNEPDSEIIYDPSNLHKYSSDLRETKFSYLPEENEPLVGRGHGRNHGTAGASSGAVGGSFGAMFLSNTHAWSNGGVSSNGNGGTAGGPGYLPSLNISSSNASDTNGQRSQKSASSLLPDMSGLT